MPALDDEPERPMNANGPYMYARCRSCNAPKSQGSSHCQSRFCIWCEPCGKKAMGKST